MERITACTYFGYVQSTKDALLLFEAVRQNRLPKITRRLREEERAELIRSGAVFVFDEAESGVKRWTDGLYWSPSRILNNFLVYRQVEKRSGNPEEAKNKNKEHVRFSAIEGAPQVPVTVVYTHSQPSQDSDGAGPSSQTANRPPNDLPGSGPGAPGPGEPGASKDSDPDRSLVGSLTSSFDFRKNGLCKKTISFTLGNSIHHLVSYYSIEDVLLGRLRTPSSLPELNSLTISPDLLNKAHFRNPPQIELDQDGVPRYRGEPIEAPQNPRRKSNAPGNSSDEQAAALAKARGSASSSQGGHGGSGPPGTMRINNGPYSPVSATGMTGPADDFRGAHPHPPPPPPHHGTYGHHPGSVSQQFHFSQFDHSPLATSSGILTGHSGGGGGMSGNTSGEHFGNRRRVVSDAPSRLGLRTGATRYEPYPSSSLHSSEGGHTNLSGGGGNFGPYAGSSDSHMSSPATRRDLSLMGSGGPGPLSPADSRPQSARLYGEHQNGFNGGSGWRNDAGYVPVTPNAGSVNSSTAQSPREHGGHYAPPLPPPIGGAGGPPPPPMGTTVSPTEYFQPGRGGGPSGSGPHDVSPYYPQPLQGNSSSHMHSRTQTRGTDWSNDGAGSTSGAGMNGNGGSGGGGGGPNMAMQGMPGEGNGYMYMQSSGSGSGSAGGGGGLHYEYGGGGGSGGGSGGGGGHMAGSDRSMSAEQAGGSRSDGNPHAPTPYYPNMNTWAPPPPGQDATMQVMQQHQPHHGMPMPPVPPGSTTATSASSQQGGSGFRAPGPGPNADWRAAQEAHHAHRSNSMSSDFSATGGSGSLEWNRSDSGVYTSASLGGGGVVGSSTGALKSPLSMTMRDGSSSSSGGLERVVLRRPPAN